MHAINTKKMRISNVKRNLSLCNFGRGSNICHHQGRGDFRFHQKIIYN